MDFWLWHQKHKQQQQQNQVAKHQTKSTVEETIKIKKTICGMEENISKGCIGQRVISKIYQVLIQPNKNVIKKETEKWCQKNGTEMGSLDFFPWNYKNLNSYNPMKKHPA